MADENSRKGERYVHPDILAFVEGVHATDTGAFAAAFDAPKREGIPAIQVSRVEARLLGLILAMSNARKVVEVGTLAGYSALHMASRLAEGGRLWSLELDARHAALARGAIADAGLSDRVEVRVGAAIDLLPELASEGPFDAVFIDGDKENYPAYGAWAAAHLRPRGLLLADNVYYFGQLMDDSEGARAMRRFHEQCAVDFDTTCVPTPDGLLLGIRK
ncbi:MAG: O-methyltransferase [Myxococcales bacterium]|nr:O-methyltransferase [Myxococcales bacterium]MDD9965792.1 O-methyltransferase [Myxococcales bacterium]